MRGAQYDPPDMTRNEHPGSDPALYDADFFTWTQRQAAALRAMPRNASVDVDRVAEEIEDLGKSELHRVMAFLVLVLQHLIKLQVAPASRDTAHWYQETSNFQASARRSFSPGMRQLIDVEEVWTDAWHGVRRFLDDIGFDEDRAGEACPFTLEELLAKPFDIDVAAVKLAASRGAQNRGADRTV